MAMKERIETAGIARVWRGELPVESLYTAGVAGDRFLRLLKEKGRFFGTRCSECDEVYVPASLYCQRCFARLDEWVEVGDSGTLESWTLVYVGLDGKPLPAPKAVGLIRLDGATTAFVHYLELKDGDELEVGIRVKAVLKPAGKRQGAITDIRHFVLARAAR